MEIAESWKTMKDQDGATLRPILDPIFFCELLFYFGFFCELLNQFDLDYVLVTKSLNCYNSKRR